MDEAPGRGEGRHYPEAVVLADVVLTVGAMVAGLAATLWVCAGHKEVTDTFLGKLHDITSLIYLQCTKHKYHIY